LRDLVKYRTKIARNPKYENLSAVSTARMFKTTGDSHDNEEDEALLVDDVGLEFDDAS
jgi:hypothetical protein